MKTNEGSLPDYSKVGGWLLLLCVSLVILSPALGLISAIPELKSFFGNMEIVQATPGLALYEYFIFFRLFVLILFGFIAGILLWRRKAVAVGLAKTFFVTSLVLTLALPLVTAVLPLDESLRATLLNNNLRVILINSAQSIVWYLYLSRSQRVRMTYFLPQK